MGENDDVEVSYRDIVKISKEYVIEDNDQVFLVELDSILLDVLSNTTLDWSCGAPVLHILFVLEKITELLKKNRRVFDFVSFDVIADCATSPRSKFLRALVVHHLETQTDIQVKRFSGWWSAEFKDYFMTRALAFVVVGNGYAAPAIAADFDPKISLYLKMFSMQLLVDSHRCVRSSEMDFGVTTITAFEMMLKSAAEKAYVRQLLPKEVQFSKATLKADEALFQTLTKIKGGKHNNSRLINTYALVETLKQNPSMEGAPVSAAELAKLLLVHSLILEEVPLAQRSHALPKGVEAADALREKSLLPFLSCYYLHAAAALALLDCKGADGGICDVLDGRFLMKLLLVIASNPTYNVDVQGVGLPTASGTTLTELWTVITKESKSNVALFPLLKEANLEKDQLCLEPTPLSFVEAHVEAASKVKLVEVKVELKDKKPVVEEKKKEEESDSDVADWEDLADDDEGDSWDKASDDDEPEKPAPVAASPVKAVVAKTVLPQSKQHIRLFDIPVVKDLCSFDDQLQKFGVVRNLGRVTYPPDDIVDRWDNTIKFEDGINKKEEEQKQEKITDPKERRRRKRRRQRQMKDMHKYAASLVGGKTIPRDVVVATPAATVAAEHGMKKGGWSGGGKKGGGGAKGKKGKKGEAPKLSQKEQTRLAVELKKIEKENDNIVSWARAAQAQPTLHKRLNFMSRKLLEVEHPEPAIAGHLKLLEWSTAEWRAQQNKLDQANYGAAVHVFQLCHDIFRRFKTQLKPADVKTICESALCMLGFFDAATEMCEAYTQLTGQPVVLAISNKKEKNPDHLPLTSAQFQLKHAGHVMLRNVKSQKDARVKDFYPDEWQRTLLDVVDKQESALVVAPTSSGKTFISYYAMKRTLANNTKKSRIADKHFIVFVAPAPSLVNQVAADVYRTFGPVYGTLLPTFSHRVSDCEVLITVPEMLDVLLYSPVYENWVSRINYVIFDEVHCLGLDKGGVVWERILSMLDVPFVALSATLGNSDVFFNWLGKLSETYGHKVHKIDYATRWSDLQKYIYLPDRKPAHATLNAKQSQLDGTHITPIHPFAALSLGNGMQMVTDSFPPMSLAPKESIELYQTMCFVSAKLQLGSDVTARLKKLDPEVRFKASYIGKQEAGLYEIDLKAELQTWLNTGSRKAVESLLESLSQVVINKLKTMEVNSDIYTYGTDFLSEHFLATLVELNALDRLPAVVFCLNRQLCVDLALGVLFKLEKMEEDTHKGEQSGNGKKKDKANAAAAKAEKRARDKKVNGKEQREEAQAGESQTTNVVEDEYKVDPRFSFVKEGEHMNYADLKYWLDRTIMKTGWDRQHPLVRALFRGIGVHHAGMPNTYKDLVETLFRGKHIKIVIATNTLAMGINMPCRTAVFAGNDKQITPLLFRQMQGRAGRRGYDDVGHVVFVGFTPETVSRLMTSRLERLQGHYPLSNTVVLRFMNHYYHSQNKAEVVKKFKHLLNVPFMRNSFETEREADAFTAQLKYHFRFSLEYCAKYGLINPKDGAPTGLAQLVMHLHKDAPANFVFCGLLMDGTITRICSKFNGNRAKAAGDLLLVMAHLFMRIPLPAGVTANPFAHDSSCQGQVVLDPLPPVVARSVAKHDRESMELFTHSLRLFSKMELRNMDPDVTLPVSGANLPTGAFGEPDQDSALSTLTNSSLSSLARSPFACLSGHKDDFDSTQDVYFNSRKGIEFGGADDLPFVGLRDIRGAPLHLNAYAIDFFKHGSKESLCKYNNLVQNNVWFILKDWSNLLAQITDALNMIMPNKDDEDDVYKTFSYLDDKFKERIREVNAMTHKTVVTTDNVPVALPTPSK